MKVSKFLFQLDITIADFGSNNVGVLLGFHHYLLAFIFVVRFFFLLAT
jgi:hypothetical protein